MTVVAEKTAEVDDTTLPYLEAGEGDAVIFLHGALADARDWAPVLKALPEGLRGIAPTQRHFGAGYREHGARAFGTDQQAADLVDFMDALDLDRAIIAGWSFSTHSALAAAFAEPDRIKGLCLYDLGFPTFVTDPDALDAIDATNRPIFADVAAAVKHGDLPGAAQALIDAGAGEADYFHTQPESRRRIHLENAHTIPLVFEQTPPAAIGADMLAGLSTPVSIAWGEQSPLSYRIVSETAASLIPNAFASAVPRRHHLWPETHPEEFAAFIAAHVARFRQAK
ncbi:MAG: alpha/beta hydrolase [Parvularculaceae bacterium]